MTFAIYKPGQGYWVRVLTATLVGVLALAAAGWVYGQMGLVSGKLPKSVWTMHLAKAPEAAPAPGQSVELVGAPRSEQQYPVIGTAEVLSYEASNKDLRIKDVKISGEAIDAASTKAIKIGAAPVGVGSAIGEQAIDPYLLKGIGTAIVLLLGAAAAYYATAMQRRFVDFLIATDGEMKKVNWSTAKDIQSSTVVVIFAALSMSASLFVVDLGLRWFFTSIGILVK